MVLSESWVRAVKNRIGTTDFCGSPHRRRNRSGRASSSQYDQVIGVIRHGHCRYAVSLIHPVALPSRRIRTTSLISASSSANRIFRSIKFHPPMSASFPGTFPHYISGKGRIPYNTVILKFFFRNTLWGSVMLNGLQGRDPHRLVGRIITRPTPMATENRMANRLSHHGSRTGGRGYPPSRL